MCRNNKDNLYPFYNLHKPKSPNLKKNFIIPFLFCITFSVFSQSRKVQINPLADQRLFHLGFMVGLNTQDLEFTHTGYRYQTETNEIETWFAEIPSYDPGFSVGMIGEMYLHHNFSLRTIPSLHFGEKQVVFREWHTGRVERFIVKSNYFSIPLAMKISSNRVNNYRPYFLAGANVSLDLTKKTDSPILLKPLDYNLEFGFGCDFYFPYFKLMPEIKFCIGLSDVLVHDPVLQDKSLLKFNYAISKATSRMFVLTFNFE